MIDMLGSTLVVVGIGFATVGIILGLYLLAYDTYFSHNPKYTIIQKHNERYPDDPYFYLKVNAGLYSTGYLNQVGYNTIVPMIMRDSKTSYSSIHEVFIVIKKFEEGKSLWSSLNKRVRVENED